MAAVSVTIRIDEGSKEMWRELADKEGRSLGGYLERVLTWMKDRELLMEASALDVIADRLVTISNRLEEMNRRSEVKKRSAVKKSSPYDVELFDGLSQEAWHRWVNYRIHIQKVPIRYEAAVLAVEQLKEWDDEGYNVEAFIDNAIKEQALKIFIPREAKNLKGKK